MFLFDFLLMLMGVLISVAFLTLMERKFMGYGQLRKGPNKVLIQGVLQPFSDVLKLFPKSFFLLYSSKYYFYILGPLLGILLMSAFWVFYPSSFLVLSWNLEMLFFFSFMTLMSYFLFFCGFSTTSSFSFLGFIRSVSQTISYEVCLIIFVLWVVYSFSSLVFSSFRFWEVGFSFFFLLPVSCFVWMLMSLSESNRSPFDFSEGESELVSGFNVEYGGGLFSIIFVTEYGMVIFMGFLSSFIFFSSVFLVVSILAFSFFYIWCRTSFPRFRYDKLMELSWMSLAPLVVVVLLAVVEFFLLLKSQYV